MDIEKRYVVLDVETNGLKPAKDDLLSISIYKPDDHNTYNRFLPLELAQEIRTTRINGITQDSLKGAKPLSQQEVNQIIIAFELDRRTILTYTDFDSKFLKYYFARKNLHGFEQMHFYNFKNDIISSKFSGGNVTKDNLCSLYNIQGVRDIHSSLNDCILEWELFKRINGKKLFITNNDVFEIEPNTEYLFPVGYISYHKNLRYFTSSLPKIKFHKQVIKRFVFDKKKLKRFRGNADGILIEHLINLMLHVRKNDNYPYLRNNKSKLNYIGRLPAVRDEMPIILKEDGLIQVSRPQDAEFEKEANLSQQFLKRQLDPLIQFISRDIFQNQPVISQELVTYPDKHLLAVCDLSSSDAILEIKTNYTPNISNIKEQLYYEAKGRQCFLLQINWDYTPDEICFLISQVDFCDSL